MTETEDIPQVGDQDTPPQTPPQQPPTDKVKAVYDAVSQDYDLGDYNSFRQKMNDPVKRKALYETVNHEYDLGNNFDDFEKKLEPSIGPLQSTIENIRGLQKTSTEDPMIDAGMVSGKSSELSPDFKTKKDQATKDYNDKLAYASTAWGEDPKNVSKVLNDFPNQNDPNALKEHINLLKTNPSAYDDFRAADQNKNLIANSPEGGVHLANIYNELQGSPDQPLEGLHGVVEAAHRQTEIIYSSLSGHQRQQALDNLASNKAKYFNAASPDIQEAYAKDTEFNKELTPVQYAGLEYLKAFNPQQYEQYKNLIKVNPETTYGDLVFDKIKGNVPKTKEQQNLLDQQIGLETIKKNLLDIGRGNTQKYAAQQAVSLGEQYDQATDPEHREAIRQQFSELNSMMNGIRNDIKTDEQKFPYLTALKFDNQIKELTQDAGTNPFSYLIQRFKQGQQKSDEGIDNVITSLFGTDEQNYHNQLRALGSPTSEESANYLPESLKPQGSPFIYQPTKELKDIAKAIHDSPDLTDDQKNEQLHNLVKLNQDQIDYVTNPNAGKSANVFSKATLYRNAGMIGDIASFAAQSAGLGATGVGRIISQGLPMFLQSQSDYYKEAVQKGYPNPSAYADTHAAIMFAAGMINPDINIAKRALGVESGVGKILAGVDEKTWNEVIQSDKPLLAKIKNSISSAGSEAVKIGAVYGAGTSLAHDVVNQGLFNSNQDTGDIVDNAVKATRDVTLSSMAILGLNAINHFKIASPTEKANVWELGHNPDIGLQQIDDAVTKGEISQQTADQRKTIVKNIAKLVDRVPTQDAKGNPLTDKQRSEILYNNMIKGKIGEMKSDMPEHIADKLSGIETTIDLTNGEILQPGSAKQSVVKELNDLKFGDKSPWKTVEGNGGQLLKDIQEQATGWHRSSDEVGSPLSFNNLHNIFPEHLIENAIRVLPDADKQHIMEMYDTGGFKVPQKLRDYLYVPKIEKPATPAPASAAERAPVPTEIKPAVVMPGENRPPNVVTNVKVGKIPFDDFRDHALSDFEHVTDSKWDWRITADISTEERIKGIQDIKSGRKSAAARKIEAAIKDMYDKGIVPMNRGRGNHAESHDFTFEDLGHMQNTVDGIEVNLHKWLNEESQLEPIDQEFLENNIDDVISHHETDSKGKTQSPVSGSPGEGDKNAGTNAGRQTGKGGTETQSITIQTPTHATPEQTTNAVDVRQQTGNGPAVGTRNTEHQEPAGTQGESTHQEKIDQVEAARTAELNKNTKPKAKLDLPSTDDIVKTGKDRVRFKEIADDIKERGNKLKDLINCLWAA